MKNGEAVREFETRFAEYVGAKYCIALCNGTATLHTALMALGVKPGDKVAVPPLTMSATTIAVLQAGAVPVFVDVDPDTWVLGRNLVLYPRDSYQHAIPVDLYGLWCDSGWPGCVADAAQTLRRHNTDNSFTSYSFQASKILALGEGGALVTDDEEFATWAREFSSLGYRMRADQPRIDPAVLKHPSYERHHTWPCYNYRMADHVARYGLSAMLPEDAEFVGFPGTKLKPSARLSFDNGLDALKFSRQQAARLYAEAVSGCDWIKPQHVPEGWTHDYWCYTVALEYTGFWLPLADAIERNGGERPYAAWRLTYTEPAFAHLAPPLGSCPVAESLQPRLMQFQTNSLDSAERNAEAVRKAIREIGGAR